MERTDRIVKIIREMMAVGASGFTGSGNPKTKGGFDPLIGFQRRGKTDYRKVPKTYKDWVKSLEGRHVRIKRKA